MSAGRVTRIGVFGHYGNQNLGDEAISTAVFASLERLAPTAELHAFSLFPDDSRERYGVPAHPIQRLSAQRVEHFRQAAANRDVERSTSGDEEEGRLRRALKRFRPLVAIVRFIRGIVPTLVKIGAEAGFLLRNYRAVGEVDLLIIAGSNQCFDYFGGPWNYPYTLLKWTFLARLRGCRVAFASVGAGPIRSPLSGLFLRWALGLAQYRSFRDPTSLGVIRDIGAARPGDGVVPDLALSLPVGPLIVDGVDLGGGHRSPSGPDRAPVVGINPMPVFDGRFWPVEHRGRYDTYVTRMASFTEWLVAGERQVVYYATHPKDRLVIDDILAQVPDRVAHRVERDTSDTLPGLLGALRRLDLAVATRFHGILLPYLVNRPVLGIEYWPKTSDMMRYMGQGEYVLPQDDFLENEDFDMGTMKTVFLTLERNLADEKAVLSRRLEEKQAVLEDQYREMMSLVSDRGGRSRAAAGVGAA